MGVTFSQWLSQNSWEVALSWCVYTILTVSSGWLWAHRKLLPTVRDHERRQQQIEDLLRTDTPGGLAEVVAALDRRRDE